MKPNKGARFDVFTNISYGRHAQELPSNEGIRKRNLEEYKRDLAAEEKANAEAAALAQRNAEEEELGIHSTMNEVRAASAHENEALRKRWAHSFKSIANFVAFDENDPAGNILAHSYYDKFHTMPHVTEPVAISGEEAQKAALNFFEWLEHVQGVVLDDDSKSKIMLYVGLVASVDKLIGPRLSSCWNAAYERLANELEVLNVTREAKPQVAPELAITDYSDAATDRAVVERDLSRVVLDDNGLCNQWLTSLAENFSFWPDESQWRNAIALAEHRRLPLHIPATYDTLRVALVHAKVWPEKSPSGKYLLTSDERISDLCEQYSMSDPVQRREFFRRRNEILFGTE